MNLATLIANFSDISIPAEIQLTQLTLDSRLVTPGSAFLAISGTHLDGRKFIDDAVTKGARAILQEGEQPQLAWQGTVPIVAIPKLRQQLGKLAAQFYGHPAEKMQIVGVTGTSGKTSCTQFIAEALQDLQKPCGVIGTMGSGLFGRIAADCLTTPDAITLHKTFAEFVKQHAQFTAMEVSSHSLDQGRVNDIDFAVGVFTNLTRDHLDYHGTMAAYGAAKKRLFAQTHYAVINADDAFGRELLETQKNCFAYSTQAATRLQFPADSCVTAENVKLSNAGISADIISPWGTGKLHSALVGQFNLSNLLAGLTTLCLLKIPFQDALASLQKVSPVSGRMQTLGGKAQPLIVVDYAHKPDALEKVLQALRSQCQGKLYCVFGCGGERDRGKRPLMAKIAEQYADQVIVTDDNPRHENAEQIVAEILTGFSDTAKINVEHDRAKAIRDAIQTAAQGDCVLIAGKGAETYQQIGDEKIPFSDIEKVKEFLLQKITPNSI